MVDTVSTRCYYTIVDTVSTERKEKKMFKGTPEIIAQRREEIIGACEQLYETMSFKDITLKEISGVTSFSRPTIYNYFHTKEEIFLALFEREYDRLNADLEKILNMEANSREELLASFKRAYGKSLTLFREILRKYNSDMDGAEVEQIMYIFFPFMFGIYPYAEVTAKQKEAMAEAEVDFKYQSIYEITYNCLKRLLVK